MTDAPAVLWSRDERGVARVTLNRPAVGNAYDGAMIDGLLAAMDALLAGPPVRAVLVTGNGRQFQAGADLAWLNAVRAGDRAANIEASRRTAGAVDRFNRLPVPTVALVQGFCVGGGTGLVAACDVVIAAEDAKFSISEVRWGLHPGIIVPQLVDAIGTRHLRRFALSGERFGADEARRIGLVHEVVPAADLEAAGERMIAQLLKNGPKAIATTKATILAHAEGGLGPADLDRLITSHAETRMSAEAAEGLLSFKEKRSARWS